MLTLSLVPTDDRASPAFRNPATLKQWLAQLQLTNLHAAHHTLRMQLDEFNRLPMNALERLDTLELLRETVAVVQADYARKLIAKKLPFSADELTIFHALIEMWQAMLNGYSRCLQAFMDEDKQLGKHGPLLCNRCLLYGSLQIFEYLRSGYEFDGALWQRLHELYSFTEGNGLQHDKIRDAVHAQGQALSCHTLYAKMLLICHANPAELSRAQLQLLDRWLTLWGDVISIERRFSVSRGDAPPLALDLGGTHGLQALEQVTQSDKLRFLAMVPLSKLLRVKTILLQQGQSPQQLELGSDFYGIYCVAFLNLLHHFWCEGLSERLIDRRNVSITAQVGFGIDMIYSYIAGKPFKPAHREAGLDTVARQQIETLGHTLAEPAHSNPGHFEPWHMENENILGTRLLRDVREGERIGLNQLVAVRPADAETYTIGTVKWRSVTRSGQLHVGVHYLPGVPHAISLQASGGAASGKPVVALLLPAIAAQKIPASLIVPRDVFAADRAFVLIHENNEKLEIRLGFSVATGADFERVSFIHA